MTETRWLTHDPEFARRTLLRLAALAGVNGALASVAGTAVAANEQFAGKTVTFASWGGSYQDAQASCYCVA